eukprot:3689180-Amphidinium_carterae.2
MDVDTGRGVDVIAIATVQHSARWYRCTAQSLEVEASNERHEDDDMEVAWSQLSRHQVPVTLVKGTESGTCPGGERWCRDGTDVDGV